MDLKAQLNNVYEKHYKQLIIITIIFLVFSLGVLGHSKLTTGEFVKKDVTLKGGLMLTIKTEQQFNVEDLAQKIEKDMKTSATVKSLTAMAGQPIGYTIEIEPVDKDLLLQTVEKETGIPRAMYSIEESSSALSDAFFKSTIKAIIIAFVFMSIVVFAYFRLPFRSFAVIFAGFSDLIETIALMQIFGIKLSTGGVAALLMLIGYSVDADILLSARVLKQQHASVLDAIYSAIKTGITMQVTAIAALLVLYLVTPAALLRQISIILIIGLCVGIMNAWIQNAGLLRWYLEWRAKHGHSQ
ncbi:MAG: protein translocase subunit SecF [Nanoarchaeota archaeon]